MLKSLTTSTSPFLWHGVAEQVNDMPPPDFEPPVVDTWFWRNQNPFWASPALSKRSMPKKTSLQGVAGGWLLMPGGGLGRPEPFEDPGQVVESPGELYRAANPFRRMSLPGRPPLAWFQAQPSMGRGSFEPPPVNVN